MSIVMISNLVNFLIVFLFRQAMKCSSWIVTILNQQLNTAIEIDS